MVLTTNNGLGRPKLIKKFSCMFEFFQQHLLPEKDKLLEMKEVLEQKRREVREWEGKVNVQNQKVDRAYEWLEYFKK